MSKVIDIVEKYISDTWKHSGQGNIGIKCPFHKGGTERRESFFINIDTGLYFCHTCKMGGSLPRLLNDLGIPKHVIDVETEEFREMEVQERAKRALYAELSYRNDPYKANPILSETVLLNFQREGNLLPQFDEQWLKYMEIGFDKNQARIIYPIRDVYGNLAGVSGGRIYKEQDPKYLIYRGGYRIKETGKLIPSHYGSWFDSQYPKYNFDKRNCLWNFDRVYARVFHMKETSTIYIVEGFKACLWMLQNGYLNTIALLGSVLTDEQYNLLTRLNVKIVIVLDGDPPGVLGARQAAIRLRTTNMVYSVVYPDGKSQPDDLTKEELDSMLLNRKPISIKDIVFYRKWIEEEKERKRKDARERANPS